MSVSKHKVGAEGMAQEVKHSLCKAEGLSPLRTQTEALCNRVHTWNPSSPSGRKESRIEESPEAQGHGICSNEQRDPVSNKIEGKDTHIIYTYEPTPKVGTGRLEVMKPLIVF